MIECRFTDTEGCTLPTSKFGLYLSGGHPNIAELTLILSVPSYFETADGQTYDSAGVLQAGFRSLLDGYLSGVIDDDSGESLPAFAALLREFADKADAIQRPADED